MKWALNLSDFNNVHSGHAVFVFQALQYKDETHIFTVFTADITVFVFYFSYLRVDGGCCTGDFRHP